MKTAGMAHQIEALRVADGREYFAYLMEQGTGKTWTILAEAERLYERGLVDGVMVLAPNGVHTNWTRTEIPQHLSVPHVAAAWHSGLGKRARAKLEREMFAPREPGDVAPLRILAMSYDALATKDGLHTAKRFLFTRKALLALDESRRIKSPRAVRTVRALSLAPLAKYRRIATGTPVSNGPFDIFAQYEFLESGLLGTTSYRAFCREFADIVQTDDPMMQRMAARNPKAAFATIVKRDEDTGQPIYRNLGKLKRMVLAHAFRVLKRDCLDLPPKVYKTVFFELTPPQRRAYRVATNDLRLFAADGTLHSLGALTVIGKIQQITSNFVILPAGGGELTLGDRNPRLEAFAEIVEDIPGKFIVWAKYRREIAEICERLTKLGISFVQYHGGISNEDREAAKEAFQNGSAQGFVGEPHTGGLGLTLTAASVTIYYSNSYDLEVRTQSEDRNHRIGTVNKVLYIDIVAEDTIDETIAKALQRKASVSAAILNDVRADDAETDDN